MIKKEMGNRVQITEVSLRNGSLQDCRAAAMRNVCISERTEAAFMAE